MCNFRARTRWPGKITVIPLCWISEPLWTHRPDLSKDDVRANVVEVLRRVGLTGRELNRYPHEFSGGQCQRIGIARALAVEPAFLVCDEPVSALDVSVQAQVLNLFGDLQQRRGLAYLFIAHDLAVVRQIAHRVAVMYLGVIVETGNAGTVIGRPRHPYTRALLSAAPVADPERRRLRIVLEGEPPSPVDPPTGCPFHPRCPRMLKGKCDGETPALEELVPGSGHKVACFNPEN